MIKNKKVTMAMSGGVDSSVAAAILKKQGFDVIGVFMKFWHENVTQTDAENKCCSFEAYSDARRVAQKLGIPLYTMNMKVPFKKWVVDYFLKEYRSGRTPNPCVECNRFIKFGELLRKAKAMGAEYVATGHYARKQENKKTKKQKLLKGIDKKKDQSYFLYMLTQDKLKHILFPVDGYTKSQVRGMARKWKLPVHAKKDSQEICFIDARLQDFLKRWLKIKIGKIVELETGKVLGEHNGLPFYTIGQRRGLGLSGGPWYVVGINTKQNMLFVSRDEKKLLSKELVVKKVNWISGAAPKLPLHVMVKIRYKHKGAPAVITKLSAMRWPTGRPRGYKITFSEPQRAVTPGQSAVFYRGGEVLGGGIIK
jgi:tRNA-specific 2-thiouridylase